MDFHRNNLDKATSPYLWQHKDNPIHWQEWNTQVLDYARAHKKNILVSIGYATCHWCHVMAHEAFSDPDVAEFLNEYFVSIKVDREQRPDIDKYFMGFISRTTGQAGWPLNVFLNPETNPIVAMTYVPLHPNYGLPGFLQVLQLVSEKREGLKYEEVEESIEPVAEEKLLEIITDNFDKDYGGFGNAPKFPPYNTLLFLMSYSEKTDGIITKTLDAMAQKGLHDHLQGGFYRYCVDQEWKIPHFEKMLYDQAMLLWLYSTAARVWEKYGPVVDKLLKCMEETFKRDGMYVSAHDADTNHVEGDTYLWSISELKKILSPDEYLQFSKVYLLSENFDGKIHLIRKSDSVIPGIEEKLLKARKLRAQPFVDRKIVTSWNALLGIGLIHAWRCTARMDLLKKAEDLFVSLIKKQYVKGKLCHSYLEKVQKQEFLEDYAAMLLFATYIHEETGKYQEIMEKLAITLESFHQGIWIESSNPDFKQVKAGTFDHPTPSSVSLAELGLLRCKILLQKEYSSLEYGAPLAQDFHNYSALVSSGGWHIIHSPVKLDWLKLPINTLQVRSPKIQDCYGRKCLEFGTEGELYTHLGSIKRKLYK